MIASGSGPLFCRFCHHGWPSPELAAVNVGLAANDFCTVADCPDCAESAVLVDIASLASAPTLYRSVCFSCGYTYDG